MTSYADPEKLIADWLFDTLNAGVPSDVKRTKVWCDPKPPSDRWATAPWVWVQRGQGGGGLPLSLDAVLLDCDSYAASADHARALGQRVWEAMTLQLPLTTFAGGQVMVTSCKAFSAPSWAPDPQYRRAAAYEVVMHGFAAS